MDSTNLSPMLIAKVLERGKVFILSVLTDPSDHVEHLLSPGETFGGRGYEEWLAVAEGAGSVSADWLDV